jgi:hypothetical protein
MLEQLVDGDDRDREALEDVAVGVADMVRAVD